jgi:4-hydroxy-4-methyl-2-oxoglutarate aldolase
LADRVTTVPPVSAIADVLALWSLDGWLTPPLHPIVAPAHTVAGRAVTVQLAHAPHGRGLVPLFEILSNDLSGRVLVLAGARDVDGAVFGEILAGAASSQGCVATLVDGAVRDRVDMVRIAMPVCATSERVVGPNGTAHVVEIDGRVDIDGVAIETDDCIAVDASGCVRIPSAHTAAVLPSAAQYAAAEAAVTAAMAAGEPLTSAYRHKRAMVDSLTGERPA